MSDSNTQISNEMSFSFQQLREANTKRQVEWSNGKAGGTSLEFRCIELTGEVGETMNMIKKLMRTRMGMTGGVPEVEAIENIAEELADIVICCDLVAEKMNIQLGRSVVGKFNATSKKNNFNTLIEPQQENRTELAAVTAERDELKSQVEKLSTAQWYNLDDDIEHGWSDPHECSQDYCDEDGQIFTLQVNRTIRKEVYATVYKPDYDNREPIGPFESVGEAESALAAREELESNGGGDE